MYLYRINGYISRISYYRSWAESVKVGFPPRLRRGGNPFFTILTHHQNCYNNLLKGNENMLLEFRKKDLNACAKIFTAAFQAPPIGYDWLTIEKARRYLHDLTRKPGFLGFTYFAEESVVAFCFGIIDDYFLKTQYEIEEVAVLPLYHRHGVGSAMLSAVEDQLTKRNVAFVHLRTSRNIPAYDFYVRNGYTDVKDNTSLMKPLV